MLILEDSGPGVELDPLGYDPGLIVFTEDVDEEWWW